jgi:hypothetical protein
LAEDAGTMVAVCLLSEDTKDPEFETGTVTNPSLSKALDPLSQSGPLSFVHGNNMV